MNAKRFLDLVPSRDRAKKKWAMADFVESDLEIVEQGNFTVALLRSGPYFAVGVSKRNPKCDEADNLRGTQIAVTRAFRQLPYKVPYRP